MSDSNENPKDNSEWDTDLELDGKYLAMVFRYVCNPTVHVHIIQTILLKRTKV